MRNIFIDCGSNIGQGFKTIFEENNMNDDWEFYLFEPNKECCEILEKKLKFKNINIFQNAVSDVESEVDFTIEYCPNEKGWIGGASHILGENYIKPYYIKDEYLKKSDYKIKTINLSDFIKKNFSKTDFIVLKLDIEGKEFDILNRMILDETLTYVNSIYVEWHERFFSNDLTETKKRFLDFFEINKINYKIWY